ncbi:MAG: (2Fe-2S) ferredoxin domain-containing protein [Bacillota bacterium]
MEKKLVVEVCAGTTCHLMGASDLLLALKRLEPGLRERVRISFCACLGECSHGPNLRVSGNLYHRVDPELLPLLLTRLLDELGDEL